MPIPSRAQDRAQLVAELGAGSVTPVFCWRRAAGDWRVEKIAAIGGLSDEFKQAVVTAAEDLAGRSPSAYNPEGNLADNEFSTLPNPRQAAAGAPPIIGGNLFPALDDFGNAKVYRRREGHNSVPKMYVVVAQLASGAQAKFGRLVPNSNVLARSHSIRALYDKGTFSELDGTVIAFDTDFDWIEWKDTLWVLRAAGFNAVFRDTEAMKAAVAANVATIETKIKIIGSDRLIERCKSSRNMMTKLQAVIDQRLYEKPIGMLQQYSAKYPGLQVQWQDDDLVFDESVEKQWSVLRLLDEAAFTGELSGEAMLTKVKDRL
ncbi:MAG: Kiwa anti-phage protein KwaB-like domain-containing protein [Solirubrobacteraceae bacterium]